MGLPNTQLQPVNPIITSSPAAAPPFGRRLPFRAPKSSIEDDPIQGPRSRKGSNSFIKPLADEITLRVMPSGSYWSAPPHTGARIDVSSTKQSSSGSAHVFRRSKRTPSPSQQQQALTSSCGTSLAIPSLLFYSEDIPPMREEDAGDFRWVGFVTLVDQRSSQYRPRSSTPAAYGGFSDVWRCDSILPDGSNVVVAVKKLRTVELPSGLSESEKSKKFLKRLKKELGIWMQLRHPNVALVLGFTFEGEIAIISPWFSRGNVSDYLAAHPEADRMKLVQGVAAGLQYLHSPSPVVIHGDMKPANVLIDKWGCPRIIDFGLSTIIEDSGLLSLTLSVHDAGNARWIAPELLLEESTSRSRQTDMFSFGCVAFFIFTGDIPFKDTSNRQLVIARFNGAFPIQDGALYPDLHPGDALMEVLRACWRTEPQARPKIGDVLQCLNAAYPRSDAPLGSKQAIETSIRRCTPHPSVPLDVLESGAMQQGQPATRKWSWAPFRAFLRNMFTRS